MIDELRALREDVADLCAYYAREVVRANDGIARANDEVARAHEREDHLEEALAAVAQRAHAQHGGEGSFRQCAEAACCLAAGVLRP